MKKGVSPVISYVMIVAIVMMTASAAYMWAYPHMQKLGESAKSKSLSNQVRSLDYAVRQAAHGGVGFLNSLELYTESGTIRLDKDKNLITFTFQQGVEAIPNIPSISSDWLFTNYDYRREEENSNSNLVLPLNGTSPTDVDGNGEQEFLYATPDYIYYNNDSDILAADSSEETCLVDTENQRKSCPNPPSGLVSFWPLDEASGDAWDPINGNNGTVNGATQGASGQINTAYSFDGSDDYVDVGTFNTIDTGESFSVSTWANIESLSTDQYLIGEAKNSENVFAMMVKSGELRAAIHNGSSFLGKANSTAVTEGAWNHITYNYDGDGNGTLHINTP